MEKLYDIGLIGLAVMGQNLVLNMSNHGFSVAVYNRTASKTTEFMEARGNKQGNIGAAKTIAELVAMLKRPRKVMLMVKAGAPVDGMIKEVVPFLEAGDIIIDGGNSFFVDTQRRFKELAEQKIRYIGMGVSGGEEGALKGPSLMPGGDLEAYKEFEGICTKIAAQVGDEPCCAYIGKGGAGHYVKMAHNGIEYSDMQLISEAYYLMKNLLGMSDAEMHDVLTEWNKGELNSYLIEITRDILAKKDGETGEILLNKILDKAGQKGTGKWTSQSALDLGVPIPSIAEAVFARCMSAYKDERVAASKILSGPVVKFTGDKKAMVQAIHDALYSAKICSYAQGFALLMAASKEYDWDLNYGEIALLWRGGCIIRAKFLNRIKEAYDKNPKLVNLMLDPFFHGELERMQANWRVVTSMCKQYGIPAPALSSSLDYYDSYRQSVLSANMIQAQRDYFGAHTYERTDRPGIFHTQWLED